MTTARLCFLWHMHQPSYVDAETGSLVLPWVRMHAARGYLDMARWAAQFPRVKHTFNFTPCLLDQLEGLASGRLEDDVRVLCRKPAADWSAEERAFALRHFFSVAFEHNVRPLPRYAALLQKRGELVPGASLVQMARAFRVDEMRDLAVFFHLAWCGHAARAEDAGLAALLHKGGGYSEDDKAYVLAAFDRIVASIIPAYRALEAAGHVELSSTPYFHPILPLLCDSQSAARARPDRSLPPAFQFPEDAREQVRRAVATHGVRFGRAPQGMWPAEGSVSPEIVPIFEDAGLSWLASGEGVLFGSLPEGAPRNALYQPWRLPGGQGTLAGFFRDHGLSDLLGFTYYKMSPTAAATDFVKHLTTIAEAARSGASPTISVILDGENPWEHYPDSGHAHMTALLAALERTDAVRATTFSEALAEAPPTDALERLHTGSWIEASFRIWIGGEEENRAWAMLGDARRAIDGPLRAGDPRAHVARDHLLAAEGSDWFWWYGDDFATDQKAEFDRLFRARIAAAYAVVGLSAPYGVREPILRARAAVAAKPPVALIEPDIAEASMASWLGAGRLEIAASRRAMFGGAPRFSALWFGMGHERVYLRFVPGHAGWAADLSSALLRMELRGERGAATLTARIDGDDGAPSSAGLLSHRGVSFSVAARVEQAVAKPGEPLELALILDPPGAEQERYPAAGWLSLTRPHPRRGWIE